MWGTEVSTPQIREAGEGLTQANASSETTIHRNPRDLTFRRCSSEDLETCCKLAEDAWPMVRPRETQLFVESCLLWSDWAELAYESQEVVGVLICKIVKKDWLGRAVGTASRLFAYFMLLVRFILRGPPQELRFLWNFLLTDGKVARNQPRADAEIQTVIVHSSHRGEGIARALVDRFIIAARQEAQIRTMRVYTTPPLSDWRFYERYGFKRMGMFHDNHASYLTSRDLNGFFYLLTL